MAQVARFPPMASVGPEDRSIRGERNQVTFDLSEYAAGLNKSASPDDQKRTMVSLPEHSHDALELKFAGLLMECRALAAVIIAVVQQRRDT